MKIINYKIAELVRRKNKKHKSSVLSRIVMNIKQLLTRAHPGHLFALYSPAKKKLNLTRLRIVACLLTPYMQHASKNYESNIKC